MQLFYLPTSPYVRKVLACAISREIEAQIALVDADPYASPPGLLAANPLSRVPCLLTEDGFALFDSPVICEYLDTIGDVLPLFPAHGRARWVALRQQAMADGIMDAAVARRMEQPQPPQGARAVFIDRQRDAVERTLDALEHEPPHLTPDIGSISIACALGYLDFRFGPERWRDRRPQIAAWYESFAQNPCIARTVPKDSG